MSPVERVLWGTLLGVVAVLGFILWAHGYWSAFIGQLAGLVTAPPTSETTPGLTAPASRKGGP